MTIHKNFKLDGKGFSSAEDLLDYVKIQHPGHHAFLSAWFDDAPYLRVHTSGSTGIPKPIDIPKTGAVESARNTIRFFNLPPGSRALLCLSAEYIAGKMMWIRALTGGWDLHVVPVDSMPLQHTGAYVDFAAMVPIQVENSLENLHTVRKLIIGGAPLPESLEKKLQTIPVEVYHTYGMTETYSHVAVRRLNTSGEHFKALPGIHFSVDSRNCLVIHAGFLPDTLVTHDLVELISSTEFKWIGRYDRIINSGGVKISPEIVEKKLAPYIKENFFITALPDPRLGQKVVLVIETGEKTYADLTEKIYRQAGLTRFEIPKQIIHRPTFPRTRSGKIIRRL